MIIHNYSVNNTYQNTVDHKNVVRWVKHNLRYFSLHRTRLYVTVTIYSINLTSAHLINDTSYYMYSTVVTFFG